MINNRISTSNTSLGQSQSTRLSSTVISPSTGSASSLTGSIIPVNVTVGLEKGQIIRGEVMDLRSNEVNVKLEDGRILSGKLEGSVNLSIGEKVTLQVDDVSLKNLSLKLVYDGGNSQDHTIDKALLSGGFRKTDRNYEIVKELLNQQMPIDKKTISLLIKQSLQHIDTSINTLVLMNKYRIPVTDEAITQFEAYRKGNHSMRNEMVSLTDSITELFSKLSATNSSASLSQGNELLNIILKHYTNNSTVLSNNNLNKGNMQNTIEGMLSKEAAKNLAVALKAANPLLTPEFYRAVSNGTADLKELAHVLNQMNPGETFGNTDLFTKEASTNTGADSAILKDAYQAAQTILQASEELQYNQHELGTYLNDTERANLLHSLESLSLTSMIRKEIATGNLSTYDILKIIQQQLNSLPEEAQRELFSSKEFHTLLKEELMDQWAFTPKSILKEKEIDNHFNSLYNQLNDMKELLSQTAKVSDKVSNQTGNLKDNIDFMKNLNELFTYVQLPLKLKNQTAHSELYVYSKKKEGRTASDGISVLLHLDMEHLGPLDVHIDLHHHNITGRFYLDSEDVKNIITENLPLLKQALAGKGYTLNTEVLTRSKEVNIVEEFIQKDSPSSVTRYNFDIRA